MRIFYIYKFTKINVNGNENSNENKKIGRFKFSAKVVDTLLEMYNVKIAFIPHYIFI